MAWGFICIQTASSILPRPLSQGLNWTEHSSCSPLRKEEPCTGGSGQERKQEGHRPLLPKGFHSTAYPSLEDSHHTCALRLAVNAKVCAVNDLLMTKPSHQNLNIYMDCALYFFKGRMRWREQNIL